MAGLCSTPFPPGCAESDYCHLTTTGRTSGQRRTIELWFALAADTVYLLAGAGDSAHWVANLRRRPQVEVSIGGIVRSGQARVIGSDDESARARRLLLAKYRGRAARYRSRWGGDIEDWARAPLAVAVELDPVPAPPRHDAGVDREDWDERYAGSELLWSAHANRILAAEVAELPPGRALDLACGEGRNAVWLAEHGWQVTGVDFSEVGLGKAARLAAERGVAVEWIPADLRAFVPEPQAFELVAVLYLHLPAGERREVLAHAASAVSAGGVLLVLGHDRSNLAEGYGGPKDPAILLAPEELVRELPGLTIERAERVRRPVSLPQGEAQAIDALVRARRDA